MEAVRSPAAAMSRVTGDRRGAAGFGVVALWAVVSLISTGIALLGGALRLDPQDFPGVPPETLEQFSTGANVVIPIFAVLSPFVWWALVSLVVWLASRFFGRDGTLGEIFAVVGVACVPFVIQGVIGVPLAGLQVALGAQSTAGSAVGLLSSALVLAAVAWHVILVIIGTSFARRISYGQAGGACAISCAGCGALALSVAIILVLAAAFVSG